MSETAKEVTVLGILAVGVLFVIYLLFGWIFGGGSGMATVTGVATIDGRPIDVMRLSFRDLGHER